MQGTALQAERRAKARVPGREGAWSGGGRALQRQRTTALSVTAEENKLSSGGGRRQVRSRFCEPPGSLHFVCVM